MKKIRFFALFTFLILLMSACEKENLTPPSTSDDYDRNEYIVAFFNALEMTLFADPFFSKQVLEELGAKRLADGRYQMLSSTYGGDYVQVFFSLQLLDRAAISKLSAMAVEQMENLLKEAPYELASMPTLKETYEQHRCAREVSRKPGFCHVIGRESSQNHYELYYQCERTKENRLCTETYRRIGENRYYPNRDCSGRPRRTVTLYGFRCD